MGGNQYKPNPPLDSIAEPLRVYFRRGLTDPDILKRLLLKHIDTTRYGLGITRFRAMRNELGLLRVRTLDYQMEDVSDNITRIRVQYPKAGVREIKRLLRDEQQLLVSRRVIEEWCRHYEPDLVRARRKGKYKRQKFWAAGVNDVWCADQHDKWKRFGLALHVCVDPFSGKIKWLKVWWTNNNPRLIFSYYLECVREGGYICMVTQSDMGSENFCFAKGHTYIRQSLDPDLRGTLQHRWRRDKKNVQPEIVWSNVRRRFAPGFEDILESPQRNPDIRYNPQIPLQYNVFKWIFIPWMQAELDAYRLSTNRTAKRHQKHKVIPQGGAPDDIEEFPQFYQAQDFRINVDRDAECLKEAENLYAPPDHPVFELVPPEFAESAEYYYSEMGRPEITRDTIWNVYMELLVMFEENMMNMVDQWNLTAYDENYQGDGELVEEVRQEILEEETLMVDEDDCYIGGVNDGLGPNAVDGVIEWETDSDNSMEEMDMIQATLLIPEE